MKDKFLMVAVVLFVLNACGSTPAEQSTEAQPTAEQAMTEESAPAAEAPSANTSAPANGPYMPLTADAEVQTKNPVNNEPFPQTDIQVMYLSNLEIPAAQVEITTLYTDAGWTVTVTEAAVSLVTFTAAPPSSGTWKGKCTMGLQKGSPEVMGTPKLVIKGLCYAD